MKTDDKIDIAQVVNFVSVRMNKIVGIGEIAAYQHFSFFHSIYTLHNKVEGGILESPWLYVRPSVCPWTQFCSGLFSYSFACTALKFIHNVCVHMKLCMCNFHDHTIIVMELSPLELVNFTELLLSMERNNPTVLHVLNSKLHTVLLVVYSCNFHYHTVIGC